MKKLLLCLCASIATVTSDIRAADTSTPVPPRFSVQNMDRSADPKKDFARFAYGNWLDHNPIPADKSRWGGFDELAQYNWKALHQILESVSTAPNPEGSPEAKVADLYRSAMDTNHINSLGLKPLEADLARVDAVKTLDDLAHTLAYFHNDGIGGLFRIGVGPDQKNSDMNALHASQGGMSLPSKDYYFAERFESARSNFVIHVAKMFTLAGASEDSAAKDAKTVFEVEKALAQNAKAPVELRDALANYNPMHTADLKSKVGAFPFDAYLKDRAIIGPAAEEIIVGQPKFYEGLQDQLTARPIAEWKAYLRYQLLNDSAPFLSEPFEKERFHFYATILSGTPEMEPRWQRSARVIDRSLGEALGQLYVGKYYPPEAEKRMAEMIKNLQAVMRERLQKIDWMTEATRQKALAKFDRFVPRIGHPEKWRDYSSVVIKPDDYFGNVRRAEAFEVKRRVSKLGQPVDKSEWNMTPPTVNAYFQATANQIVFPAGILQPPFFDFTLDDPINYGAIGAVIGHEITHGFDDQGRRYDANGNLNDWWTKEDADNFQARAKKVVEQYSSYTPLPGQHVNGELTLGENIADLGGVSIAFEALQRSLKGKERKLIDGFTPEQRFFLSWAQQWRTNFREDALRRQMTTDPHSPGMIRAFAPLTDMPEFFTAFGIKEGDPMYRKPDDRAKIW
jgi:putative endopeptidase